MSDNKKNNKKRINIYVDIDTYTEFKKSCSFFGDTVTNVIDSAMKEYINAINMIVEAGNKDKLIELIQKRFDNQMNNIETDIQKEIETKRTDALE